MSNKSSNDNKPARRFSADEAPVSTWMARGAPTLVGRMARHDLTAESLLQNGSTLAERFIYGAKRFHFNDYNQNIQLGQLDALLSTCKDPSGKAATWLRALSETPSETLSKEQQFKDLDAALKEKLQEQLNEAIHEPLKWTTLALRGAAAISKDARLNPDEEKAASLLAATAFSALPHGMKLKNKSMLQTRAEENSTQWKWGDPNWNHIKMHFIDLSRSFDAHGTMEPSLLPFQLWLVSEIDGYSLEDQKVARANDGLVPYSMVGHAPFQKALEAQLPWPEDPRNSLLLEWHEQHNPLLAARVGSWMQASTLQTQTQPISRPANKSRL